MERATDTQGMRCIPKLLVNGDDRWTSRSDDLMVAVGFNPRNEPGDLKSREATIDPPEIWRSDRTSLRDLLLGGRMPVA